MSIDPDRFDAFMRSARHYERKYEWRAAIAHARFAMKFTIGETRAGVERWIQEMEEVLEHERQREHERFLERHHAFQRDRWRRKRGRSS